MKVMGDIVNLVGPLSISIILSYMTMIKRNELPYGTAEKVWILFFIIIICCISLVISKNIFDDSGQIFLAFEFAMSLCRKEKILDWLLILIHSFICGNILYIKNYTKSFIVIKNIHVSGLMFLIIYLFIL